MRKAVLLIVLNPEVARPDKELNGFRRVELAPGETKRIST